MAELPGPELLAWHASRPAATAPADTSRCGWRRDGACRPAAYLHAAAPLPVHGMMAVAGVGDLAWAAPFLGAVCSPNIIARLVDEKQRGKEAWADTSPAAMAPLAVPVTMISGLSDPIVAPAHARRFALAAGSRGGPSVTLLNLNEAGHFELIAPWTPTGAATVHAITDR